MLKNLKSNFKDFVSENFFDGYEPDENAIKWVCFGMGAFVLVGTTTITYVLNTL